MVLPFLWSLAEWVIESQCKYPAYSSHLKDASSEVVSDCLEGLLRSFFWYTRCPISSNKKTFKDFFESDHNPDKSCEPELRTKAVIYRRLHDGLWRFRGPGNMIHGQAVEMFSQMVSDYTQSDEFVTLLSSKIGQVSGDEDEEAFVIFSRHLVRKLVRIEINS